MTSLLLYVLPRKPRLMKARILNCEVSSGFLIASSASLSMVSEKSGTSVRAMGLRKAGSKHNSLCCSANVRVSAASAAPS